MSDRKRARAGYTLVEILTVVAIMGSIVLVTLPSITDWYDRYLLNKDVRGLAGQMQVARMLAVGRNVTHVAELVTAPTALTDQCQGAPQTGKKVMVIYRSDATGEAIDCYVPHFKAEVSIKSSPVSATVNFRANGMAQNSAPNFFLVTSRSGLICQVLCVNAAGAVRQNHWTESCSASPFGAGPDEPCQAP